jgi:hypothetical protein
LAKTSTPNPQGRHDGNVRQRQARTHEELAVTEFITNSVDSALKPGLDSDRRPIAFLIVWRTGAGRKIAPRIDVRGIAHSIVQARPTIPSGRMTSKG